MKTPDNTIVLDMKDHQPIIQASLELWSKRNSFEYRLMHKCEDHAPYCIYAMVHSYSEAASKAKIEECVFSSGENGCKYVSTETLVQTTDSWPSKYDVLAVKFREAVRLYSSVVPSVLVSEICQDIRGQIELLEKLDQVDQVRSVQSQAIVYKFLAKLAEIEVDYEKDIRQVEQRNNFCYQHLKSSLLELGFIPKPTIEQCDICIHGESLMAMYFYKYGGTDRTVVKSAIIRTFEDPEDNDSDGDNSDVIGGVEMYYVQTFVDMVRVGSLLTQDALMRGSIIDKIVVFGLLTNYKTGFAVVMKYYVNFLKGETCFYVGEEMNAVRGFIAIIQTMDS